MNVGSVAKQISAKHRFNSKKYKKFDCSDIFSGLAIGTETDNVDSLRDIAGIVNVWPLRSVPIAPIAKKKRVAPRDGQTNYTMHHWTGVDKLHADGIRGKGVTVAVIDTGIDYTHKAVSLSCPDSASSLTWMKLGGCFGPGCKVSGGYDLVAKDCRAIAALCSVYKGADIT